MFFLQKFILALSSGKKRFLKNYVLRLITYTFFTPVLYVRLSTRNCLKCRLCLEENLGHGIQGGLPARAAGVQGTEYRGGAGSAGHPGARTSLQLPLCPAVPRQAHCLNSVKKFLYFSVICL